MEAVLIIGWILSIGIGFTVGSAIIRAMRAISHARKLHAVRQAITANSASREMVSRRRNAAVRYL